MGIKEMGHLEEEEVKPVKKIVGYQPKKKVSEQTIQGSSGFFGFNKKKKHKLETTDGEKLVRDTYEDTEERLEELFDDLFQKSETDSGSSVSLGEFSLTKLADEI